MRIRTFSLCCLLAVLALGAESPIVDAATNDRIYLMGDGDSPVPVNNGNVTTTFDSQGVPSMSQFVDLLASPVRPKYRTITGRPDGVGGFGVEFTGSQYLRNFALGLPSTSFSALGGTHVGTLNYNTLVNRGLQFWVRPTSTATQSLVMDTNQHGVRISGGFFSMRYNNVDYVTTRSVAANTWYHVMLVRPNGPSSGSQLYINGEAVSVALGDYNHADTAPLVVGANTAGSDTLFGGGTTEFFSGIVDDLKLFVIGNNSADSGPPPGQNWGAFSLFADNDYVDWAVTSTAGDIDLDGDLDQNDKNAFVAGWMHDNVIGGLRIADLASYKKGDLNKDGRTDIFDLALMQNALTLGGLATITAAELAGVPEPAAAVLFSVGAVGVFRRRRPR